MKVFVLCDHPASIGIIKCGTTVELDDKEANELIKFGCVEKVKEKAKADKK